MKIEEIRKNVWHFQYDTQYHLTSSFMRLQEYYESPFPALKGRFFKHEEYMDAYAEKNDNFTYYEDWSGFNVPGNVVLNFFDHFRYDFWVKEALLFDWIAKVIPQFKKGETGFYIIGTSKDDEDNDNCIKHELAHAYWYLYYGYELEMQSIINNKLDIIRNGNSESYADIVSEVLEQKGYDYSVIKDEIQAYLSTSSRRDLIESLGEDISKIRIPSDFHKFFNEFDKKQLQIKLEGVDDERKNSKRSPQKSSRRKTNKYNKLTIEQKIKKLDDMFGKGVGAKKERAKLQKQLEARKALRLTYQVISLLGLNQN